MLVSVLLAFLWVHHDSTRHRDVSLTAEAASAAQSDAASALPLQLPWGPPQNTLPAPSTRPTKETTQDERFDALARSDSARDRFEAYRLALICLNEAQFDRMPNINYIRQCELQPGKWQDAELRHKLLRQAALDGVPRAWWALREEGPGGRFQSIPDSLQYRELEARAYAAALEHADFAALTHEAGLQEAYGNVERALTLKVASGAALARLHRLEYDPQRDPNLDLNQYREQLGLELARQAIANGLTLALKATP